MTEAELMDALDGLHAYDAGCVSSGINDYVLKARCRIHLQRLPQDERRRVLARIGRELYLTDKRIEQRYGLEDIRHFAQWLDDEAMS